ncbi:MAG: Por secretion system C-terminal sorting protein [Chitinophagaceae bacterium]|nr:Por secretion system C-terminal sorting protein [Chitinophagaceae bacterium]
MRLVKILLICLICIPCKLIAQPGALIPSFGQFGIAVTTESLSRFENILPLANGQFLLTDHETASHTQGNGFTESATFSIFRRCNADGTFDETYGSNGKRRFISSDLVHQYFTGFARLSDGRIVAIETYGYNGQFTPLNNVWIFNSDGTGGTIIAELAVFGYFSLHLNSIAVDGQNRIVVTGWVKGNSGADKTLTYIARLLPDGSLDESFNHVGFRVVVENSSYNYSGEQVTTDAGNNVIIVEQGYYGTALGNYITKYLEDGSHVTAFGNVNATAVVRSLITDGNSKIIFLVGATIKRLNANGTADVTFQSSGISIKKLVIQPDNKVIAVGSGTISGHSVFKACRFGTGGTLDPAFGTNGTVITDLNFGTAADDAIYVNRRLYVSGYVAPDFSYGTIVAYDGSDVRMTCPTPQNPYNVDAGKCYATINGINAVMSSSTLWANVQNTVVYNGTTTTGEGGVAGQQFQLGTTHITYSYTDITTQTCSFDITVTDQDPPVARCKNVTVQLDETGNGTLTAAQVDNGSTDGCGIQSMSLSKTSFNCSDPSSNTVTLTVNDVHGNSSTCNATITVEDNVPPVAKCKNVTVYLDATGNGSITTDQINDGSTDACGIKSLSLDITTFNCTNKGNNTVTLTVTDNHDNSSTCTSTVTVVDNLPPVISSVVPTPSAIWPTDRKMKNVSVATAATDNCNVYSCSITGVVIKAGEFAGDNIGPDWQITSANTVNLRAEIPKKGIKRIYTVTVTCTDASNNSSTSTTDVIVAHNITTPASGATVRIGSTVNLAGEFWDVAGKKHTAKWLIDDKTLINGTVTEPLGMNSGTVTGSYKFTTAGVYKIQMNVTDQNGITSYSNTSENLEAIVVVYDPDGGHTYGGGWFNSPAGALPNNSRAIGEVSYGFAMNYYKNATLPKGETQFEFKVGDFEFNAVTFDYLSINKAKAQFKGTGKITGGQSGINFIMTVIDGQLDGTNVDKVRMKIYNKNTGQVYYDNQPGASDAANPVTPVGQNSSIVISSNAAITRSIQSKSELNIEGQQLKVESEQLKVFDKGLQIQAFPNPARKSFTFTAKSSNSKDIIVLYVLNVMGRVIESRTLISDKPITFGDMYRPGAYYIRVIQGKEQKQMKLIKLSD